MENNQIDEELTLQKQEAKNKLNNPPATMQDKEDNYTTEKEEYESSQNERINFYNEVSDDNVTEIEVDW